MNRLRHIFIVLTALYYPAVMANDSNATQTDEKPCTCVFNMNRAWNPEKIIWNNEAWKCTIYKDDGTCSEVQKVASLDDNNNAFLLAASSERMLSESELNRYDATDLRLIRNEIFARHGYTFKSEDLRTFFLPRRGMTP
ncbi:YARHG domain-containing protein [Vibrio algarum]|uniref:YARHG domain-containing protein n=1 Tax=Vibrio algarum TaxID=3020714 RepID=A0ABT4YQZ5_9VIBR|nr:YARHG domain-containing protein [Vibrio sp. KJ40-1]MDB1123795.1 YARHG domain-containing protein [Vibrio sp. KJ40-1]